MLGQKNIKLSQLVQRFKGVDTQRAWWCHSLSTEERGLKKKKAMIISSHTHVSSIEYHNFMVITCLKIHFILNTFKPICVIHRMTRSLDHTNTSTRSFSEAFRLSSSCLRS